MKRVLMAVVLGVCGLTAATVEAQQAVFLVRHAEKADASKDPPLSPAGEARARQLATLLRDAGITAIYVTEYQRNRATAEPLAKALKLELRVMSSKNSAALVERLRTEHARDRVLVVGHTNTLPEILTAFGATEKLTLADPDYDNLFVLVPRKDAPPTVVRLHF